MCGLQKSWMWRYKRKKNACESSGGEHPVSTGSKSAAYPSGPPGLPVLGVARIHPKIEFWKAYADWGNKYGVDGLISFHILGHRMVVLNSAADAANLLTKRSAVYSDRLFPTMAGLLLRHEKSMFYIHRKLMHHSFNATAAQMYWEMQEHEARVLADNIVKFPDELIKHLRRFSSVSFSGLFAIKLTWYPLNNTIFDPLPGHLSIHASISTYPLALRTPSCVRTKACFLGRIQDPKFPNIPTFECTFWCIYEVYKRPENRGPTDAEHQNQGHEMNEHPTSRRNTDMGQIKVQVADGKYFEVPEHPTPFQDAGSSSKKSDYWQDQNWVV
ncbi:hypothetical protein DFH07DRAFT_766009 [Mycena maculata]|uniref:Cytochrome P450 n=1 Tax=Mycena maculata TaxID=230809 RepID=A0AAD7NX57_9AGAR|nr:hypothetical protein DFH07DRAFT_766009 [Mycena maculata]